MLNYIENIRHTLFESSYRDYQLIPSYLLKPNKVVIIGRRVRPLLRSCFGFWSRKRRPGFLCRSVLEITT